MEAKLMQYSWKEVDKIIAAADKFVEAQHPAAYVRIVRKEQEKTARRLVEALASDSAAEIEPGDIVWYVHRENLGTKKWPWVVDVVVSSRVESVGESVVATGLCHRPAKHQILAVEKVKA